MADEIEGAVNDTAGASPAIGTMEQFFGDDEFVDDLDDDQTETAATTRTATTNATDVGDQDAEDDTLEVPENQGGEDPAAETEREGFIPRVRFDQVNGRAQELETEVAAQREAVAMAKRAMAAGYRDVAQFEHDDAWAKANNYENIEQYHEVSSYNAQLAKQVQNGDITEQVRQQMVNDRRERLQTQTELREVRGLLQSVQKSTLDQTIASAKAQFEHVDPAQWAEIERLCRDIGRPDAVQRVISTFAPALKGATKTAAQRAVIDANARRAAANGGAGSPPPEGSAGGGRAPRANGGKIDHAQAKSRLLSDLLGFRK